MSDVLCVFFPFEGLRVLPAIWCRREISEEPVGNSTMPLTTASGTALYCARDSASWQTANSVPTISKPVITTKIEVKIYAKFQFSCPDICRHRFHGLFLFLLLFVFVFVFLLWSTVEGWVGWRNDSRNGQPVEIVFEFDTVRDFTSLSIFANNQFTKDVQVGSYSFHQQQFATSK